MDARRATEESHSIFDEFVLCCVFFKSQYLHELLIKHMETAPGE